MRYLPWTAGADVGGDWYDIIPLGPDTVAIVIGDIAGHSPQAAAKMGQLRNAIRAFAADGHSPTGVLHRTNQALRRLEPLTMATCYLEVHLAEGTATAVLAGHPPPVLRTEGLARCLPMPTGPPLGALAAAQYVDSTFLLPTGSTLLLYTDGLVEDRRYHIDRGLNELCAAVGSAPGPDPDALIDYILHVGIGPAPRRDDVAVLALTVDAGPQPGPPAVRRRLRADTASAAAACRFARDIVTAWRLGALAADTCLLLDDLVSRAVRRTVGDVEVRIILQRRLRVEVHTDTNWQPVTGAPDSVPDGGPALLDRLCQIWGVEPLPGGGNVVWCELASPATIDD